MTERLHGDVFEREGLGDILHTEAAERTGRVLAAEEFRPGTVASFGFSPEDIAWVHE